VITFGFGIRISKKTPGVENSQFFGAGKMVKKTIKNDKK
jgi:hypothetical protein